MKELTVTYIHMTKRASIDDDAKADAAYAAIKAAMGAYREYGNDKETTVEIDIGTGVETIRIGAIASVGLCDLAAGEDTIIKLAVWQRRIEAKVTAALQPAAE